MDSIAYQSRDLLDAMRSDAGLPLNVLKVDGGASANDALMQFQADIVGATVRRPIVRETTALGAAYLAGLAVGYWSDLNDVSRNWAIDKEFAPHMAEAERQQRYAKWKKGVERALAWAEP